MGTPQPALFVDELAHHAHLEWTLRADSTSATAREAVAAARRAAATLRSPASCWGFDPMLWRRWSACPDNVRPFAEVTGPGGTAPPPNVGVVVARRQRSRRCGSRLGGITEMLAVADRTDDQVLLPSTTAIRSDLWMAPRTRHWMRAIGRGLPSEQVGGRAVLLEMGSRPDRLRILPWPIRKRSLAALGSPTRNSTPNPSRPTTRGRW
jgi:hypothetical protein